MDQGTAIEKRVELIGKHPHAGERGTIVRTAQTPVGPGLVVKLENCPHGVEEAMVFRTSQFRILGK